MMTPVTNFRPPLRTLPTMTPRTGEYDSDNDGSYTSTLAYNKFNINSFLNVTNQRLADNTHECKSGCSHNDHHLQPEILSKDSKRLARLYRRIQNLNFIKKLTESGWRIEKVTGWGIDGGVRDGKTSQYDTFTLKNGDDIIEIKLDSSIFGQDNGYLKTKEPPLDETIQCSDNKQMACLTSSQGIVKFTDSRQNNSIHIYAEKTERNYTGPNNELKKLLSDFEKSSKILKSDEIKIKTKEIVKKAKAKIQECFTYEWVPSLWNKSVLNIDNYEKFSNEFAKKLDALADLEAPRITRANGGHWKILNSGQIQVSRSTSMETHESTLNFWIQHSRTNKKTYDLSKKVIHDEETAGRTKLKLFTLANACMETPYLVKEGDYHSEVPKTFFKELLTFLLDQDHNAPEKPLSLDTVKTVIELHNKKDQNQIQTDNSNIDAIMLEIMMRLKDMALLSDHLGLCCPECDSEKKDTQPAPAYFAPKFFQQSAVNEPFTLEGINPLNKDSTATNILESVKNELTKINTRTFQKMGLADSCVTDYKKAINKWQRCISNYLIEDEYKIAQMIEFTLMYIDKVTAYESEHALKSEVNHAKALLKKLTTIFLEKITGEGNEFYDVASPLRKYQFSFLQTIANVASIEEDLATHYNDLYNKVTLRLDIEDERNVIERTELEYNEPKQSGYNRTEKTLHEALLDIAPLDFSLIAGKIGVGKSALLSNLIMTGLEKGKSRLFIKTDADDPIPIHGIFNIEKESSNFDSRETPTDQTLLTIKKDKIKSFMETTSVTALQKDQLKGDEEALDPMNVKLLFTKLTGITDKDLTSQKQDTQSGAKVVGCACCKGRSVTATAVSEIDRGLSLNSNKAILLDSIGYADHSGMATLPQERVFARTFLNQAVTITNLNNPAWTEIATLAQKLKQQIEHGNLSNAKELINEKRAGNHIEEDLNEDTSLADCLGLAFDGTFNNVLIQQLKYATVLITNNFGHGAESEKIGTEQLKELHKIMNESAIKPQVINLNVTDRGQVDTSGIKEIVTGTQSARNTITINHTNVTPEPYKGDSELDQDFTQVDVAMFKIKNEVAAKQSQTEIEGGSIDNVVENFTDKQKLTFVEKLFNYGIRRDIDRAKGCVQIQRRWFKFEISDGVSFNIKEIQQIDGKWVEIYGSKKASFDDFITYFRTPRKVRGAELTQRESVSAVVAVLKQNMGQEESTPF